MYSWTDMVYDWLTCWDVQKNRVRDLEKYREFRNTKEGLPFEERGEAPRFERVISHRRAYAANQIPNALAVKDAGSEIQLLTCACDVQADKIYCDIMGWCEGARSFGIDFRVLDGDTIDITRGPWKELEKIIETEVWTADDGRQYRIRATFIDAGYRADQVYRFCSQYTSGVYPSFGVDWLLDGVTFRQASKATIEKAGTLVFRINTGKIKDRIAASFRRDWNTGELMPEWFPSYPETYGDDIFRMYEAEYKAKKYDKKTNKLLGIYWVQTPNAQNHKFDTHCYNIAALEMVAEHVCVNTLGLDSLDWIL